VRQRRPDRVHGLCHDEFWTWCDKGELRIQECDVCRKLLWPPNGTCEYCSASELSWLQMSGKARLISWCAFERDYYSGVLPIPWTTILVELEEGPFLISNPQGFNIAECTPGLALSLAFLDCVDNMGPYRLPVFEKA
jgi:uncharacterized protein